VGINVALEYLVVSPSLSTGATHPLFVPMLVRELGAGLQLALAAVSSVRPGFA
jgi:hypothetical protein